MAQPSVLSDKGLARFRTKTCERLLADGTCIYRSRCQYSHSAAPPRRNPTRHAYAPQLCPHAAAWAEGRGGGCARGELCPWAHSEDEVNYHPEVYKTRLCQGGSSCEDFYCPFAHSAAELRKQEPAGAAAEPRPSAAASGDAGAGQASCSTASSTPTLLAASAAGDGWWELDERLSVASEARGPAPAASRGPGSLGDRGEALAGGRIVPGLLRAKAKGEGAAPAPCRVKVVPAGRAERAQSSQVVKELKWWMSLDAGKDSQVSSRAAGAQGPARRALALRRTVATACLVLPEAASPTLGESVDGGLLGGARGPHRAESIAELCARGASGSAAPACAVLQAGAWARQLAEEVARFHAVGCAHLCISPGTVLALEDGTVRLGDFLGKIRVLGLLRPAGGSGDAGVGEDLGWAAWLPAEAQRRAARQADGSLGAVVAAADGPGGADLLRVDLWQLGVVVFFLLTGEHPFGDRKEPRAICENIQRGDAVNLGILAGPLPLFADLVARLIADAPERRWSAEQALGHPALWSWDEASHALARAPRLLPAALRGGAASGLPALAPLLAGCGAARGAAASEGAADLVAALGLQPAHAPQQEPPAVAAGAAQGHGAGGAVPMAAAAAARCEGPVCDEAVHCQRLPAAVRVARWRALPQGPLPERPPRPDRVFQRGDLREGAGARLGAREARVAAAVRRGGGRGPAALRARAGTGGQRAEAACRRRGRAARAARLPGARAAGAARAGRRRGGAPGACAVGGRGRARSAARAGRRRAGRRGAGGDGDGGAQRGGHGQGDDDEGGGLRGPAVVGEGGLWQLGAPAGAPEAARRALGLGPEPARPELVPPAAARGGGGLAGARQGPDGGPGAAGADAGALARRARVRGDRQHLALVLDGPRRRLRRVRGELRQPLPDPAAPRAPRNHWLRRSSRRSRPDSDVRVRLAVSRAAFARGWGRLHGMAAAPSGVSCSPCGDNSCFT
ncbi:unnamed protein product [Prorocentrum cordatum]|uniref:Non-specific serine/threonine protein kinase n=1 Tax=Prorocentrum cordatum TaxID=2364126 RepID=A0ABN9PWD6_9DINO|nr:unnamed protein product [Polarella glacialis]